MSNLRYRAKADTIIEKRLGSPHSYLPSLISPTSKEKIITKRLGPGTYNFSLSTLSGPSFGFGQSARFEDPFAKFMILTRKFSYQASLPEVQIETFKPNLKLSKIKEGADCLNLKVSTTRSNKRKIEMTKKEKIVKKIREKNDKYEIRRKAKDFSQLIEKTLCIMTVLTAFGRANDLIKVYKRRKARARRNLKVLFLCSTALGKFLKNLSKIRENRAYRILNQGIGRIKSWVSKQRNKHKILIKKAIDKYTQKPLLEIIQRKFIVTVLFIQKSWRNALSVKKAALQAKLKILRILESSTLNQSIPDSRKKLKKSEILKEITKIREKS